MKVVLKREGVTKLQPAVGRHLFLDAKGKESMNIFWIFLYFSKTGYLGQPMGSLVSPLAGKCRLDSGELLLGWHCFSTKDLALF